MWRGETDPIRYCEHEAVERHSTCTNPQYTVERTARHPNDADAFPGQRAHKRPLWSRRPYFTR
jgi:hypothetical protein